MFNISDLKMQLYDVILCRKCFPNFEIWRLIFNFLSPAEISVLFLKFVTHYVLRRRFVTYTTKPQVEKSLITCWPCLLKSAYLRWSPTFATWERDKKSPYISPGILNAFLKFQYFIESINLWQRSFITWLELSLHLRLAYRHFQREYNTREFYNHKISSIFYAKVSC
jgi:hypothetical protein